MKVIFFGSSDFSIPVLEALVSSLHQVVLVVTTPDQKKGRGQKLSSSVVSLFASEHGLPCLAPDRLRDPSVVDHLRQLDSDFLVIASYGKMLPESIFKLPKIAPLNVHPSLLPHHRGAAPIQRAILEGDARTGVSIAEVTAALDQGDLFARRETPLGKDENASELSARLAGLGGRLTLEVIDRFRAKTVSRTPQDNQRSTYAAKFEKDSGLIDWAKPANLIHNLVRACTPWPSAFTFFSGKRLKILRTHELPEVSSKGIPGTIVSMSSSDGVWIATGAGTIALDRVQLEGRREVNAYDFALGQRIKAGGRLGAP